VWVALTDTFSKQWQPLLDLIAALPPATTASKQAPQPVASTPQFPRRVKFTSLTSAQHTDIADLYAAGVPVSDICARFGISKDTVIRTRKRAGVPQRRRGLTESQGDEAEAMYISGKSLMTIAKRLGVGVGAVRGCLVRRGVRMRLRNGW
jgi:hypothetical protein